MKIAGPPWEVARAQLWRDPLARSSWATGQQMERLLRPIWDQQRARRQWLPEQEEPAPLDPGRCLGVVGLEACFFVGGCCEGSAYHSQLGHWAGAARGCARFEAEAERGCTGGVQVVSITWCHQPQQREHLSSLPLMVILHTAHFQGASLVFFGAGPQLPSCAPSGGDELLQGCTRGLHCDARPNVESNRLELGEKAEAGADPGDVPTRNVWL